MAVGLAAAFGGAILSIWLLPLAWGWCLLSSMFIAAAGLRTCSVHLWGSEAIAAMTWGADDEWVLLRRDGTVQRCRLLPGSYVHPQLAVLRFRSEVGDAAKRAPRAWEGMPPPADLGPGHAGREPMPFTAPDLLLHPKEGNVAPSSRKIRARHFLSSRIFSFTACRRSVVLLPDGVDPDQFRRLRVRLRLEHPGPNAAGSFTSRRAG